MRRCRQGGPGADDDAVLTRAIDEIREATQRVTLTKTCSLERTGLTAPFPACVGSWMTNSVESPTAPGSMRYCPSARTCPGEAFRRTLLRCDHADGELIAVINRTRIIYTPASWRQRRDMVAAIMEPLTT
jgi:hypothetical protein